LVADSITLDFVNTLNWRFRPSGSEELLDNYDDLLLFAFQNGLIGGARDKDAIELGDRRAKALVKSVISLRELLADFIYRTLEDSTRVPPSQELQDVLNDGRRSQEIVVSSDGFEWATKWDGDPSSILRMIAADASNLITSHDMTKVRACCDVDCGWLYLDHSKNGSRRWCDMKLCGNRNKARRFRQRVVA
jgi:predicted RNA-binding Zn ribbon-like protein